MSEGKVPAGGAKRRAFIWVKEVEGERRRERKEGGMREEYWTRWRRVRSEMVAREDCSVIVELYVRHL